VVGLETDPADLEVLDGEFCPKSQGEANRCSAGGSGDAGAEASWELSVWRLALGQEGLQVENAVAVQEEVEPEVSERVRAQKDQFVKE
jgi:hypothetical protein